MSIWLNFLASITAEKHASEWISGIAGVGGALSGALITIFATEWSNQRSRRRVRKERFAEVAFIIYQRLNKIYSVSTSYRNHLVNGRDLSVLNKAERCSCTQGMIKMSDDVNFPIEELWVITCIGGKDLINSVNSLDGVFNMMLRAMEDYKEQRQNLMESLPPPSKMQGIIGTVEMGKSEYNAFIPKINALNMSLDQIEPIASKIVNDTFQAIKMLVNAESLPLGKNFEIMMPDPSGVIVKLKAPQAPGFFRGVVKGWWAVHQSS